MIPYVIPLSLLLNLVNAQSASFSIKATSKSTLYDRSKDEYKERYKELVGMYPVSAVKVGGIFIDNIEVFGTVSDRDLGILSVKIKYGETESIVEADCGVLDLSFADLGKHLLCSILYDYDSIIGISPRSSDTIKFTNYDKVKKNGETNTPLDVTTTNIDEIKKDDTSTGEGIEDESDGESFFRINLMLLLLILLSFK